MELILPHPIMPRLILVFTLPFCLLVTKGGWLRGALATNRPTLNIVGLKPIFSAGINRPFSRLWTSRTCRNYSGPFAARLLAACGGSLILVVSAGCAACGGTARTHYTTSANCRR